MTQLVLFDAPVTPMRAASRPLASASTLPGPREATATSWAGDHDHPFDDTTYIPELGQFRKVEVLPPL